MNVAAAAEEEAKEEGKEASTTSAGSPKPTSADGQTVQQTNQKPPTIHLDRRSNTPHDTQQPTRKEEKDRRVKTQSDDDKKKRQKKRQKNLCHRPCEQLRKLVCKQNVGGERENPLAKQQPAMRGERTGQHMVYRPGRDKARLSRQANQAKSPLAGPHRTARHTHPLLFRRLDLGGLLVLHELLQVGLADLA